MHPGTLSEAGQPGNKDAPYITNGGRREYKEWFKARVVEECHAPGASVSIVARRYDINTNVLFRWRREYQLGILKPSPRSDLQETFVPVGVIDQDGKLVPETQQAPAAPAIEGKVKALPPPDPAPAPTPAPPGVVELHLSNKIKIRIQGEVNKEALRGVLAIARELA